MLVKTSEKFERLRLSRFEKNRKIQKNLFLRAPSGKVDPHTDPLVLALFRSFFLRSVAPSAPMRPG